MGMENLSSEYIPTYLISILFVSFVSILIIEWFNRRFEKFISPICEKISRRRKKVLVRETKKNKRFK